MKHFLSFIGVTLLFFCVSCSNSSNTVVTSSIARLTTFSFAAVDSLPGLGEAVFRVEERLDTGRVYNLDSIRYGTPLNKVVPKFTFEVAVGSATMQVGDTVITITGNDTIDFTQKPVYLTLVSSDKTTTKVYSIEVTVHRADPELYTWNALTLAAFPPQDAELQVLTRGETFLWYSNNGLGTSVYTSEDAVKWEAQALEGLPADCRVRTIVGCETGFYYADNAAVYMSEDGVAWESVDMADSEYMIETMLFTFLNRPWALAEKDGELCLVSVRADGSLQDEHIALPASFPVSGFTTVAFSGTSDRERLMVMGGYSREGERLDNRWNLEYSQLLDAVRVTDYAIEQPEFRTLSGTSVVWYDHKLLMFGGVDVDGVYSGREVLCSTDEGLNWSALDSTKCKLPDSYSPRQGQSALVHENNIYVFGGHSNTESFTEVYRGRLNSIDW